MIDPRELRIGNWIVHKTGTIIQVSAHEIGALNYNPHYRNDHSGVPLSAEILLACGFIKGVVGFQSNISIRKHKLLIFCVDIGLELITLSYGSDIGNSPHDVIVIHDGAFDGKLYLHNLQNLFFATTHQELIYKPTPQPA